MTAIPDAAIDAAAEAFARKRNPKHDALGHSETLAIRAAIGAAMPAIREAIAQEIEAEMADVMDDDGDAVTAVWIIRGGTQ